jgi:hypothetical protein
MLDSDVTIIQQMQDAKFNIDGTVTSQIRIEFMVGKHGPFSERFAKEGFTATKRDEALNTFAREVRTP